ncbi:ABC-three component system middle component 2 [Oceanobacillus oncorhynchi]|uniref:Threonine transporter n=2 Tax=Oceanobacillus oncorhynchi TaxID=545501 RepID=A0A0A1MVU2_9BACI|nr:hypothetical protein BN997_02845 [Oceanobacillus oncorhynchi]
MINKNDMLNSTLETALRILMLLRNMPDNQLDIDEILLLDYYVLHINDFNSKMESLHPSIPNRENEILVRRKIIQQSILLLDSRNLLTTNYTSSGIRYSSNQLTISFVDYLETPYAEKIKTNISKVNEKSKIELVEEIKKHIYNNPKFWLNEFEYSNTKEI